MQSVYRKVLSGPLIEINFLPLKDFADSIFIFGQLVQVFSTPPQRSFVSKLPVCKHNSKWFGL